MPHDPPNKPPKPKNGHLLGLRDGVLEEKHQRQMGQARWLFDWLISKETSEKDGIGIVNYGKPLTTNEISLALGRPQKTIKRWISRLRTWAYIRTTKTLSQGLIFTIHKAKRFNRLTGNPQGFSTKTPVRATNGPNVRATNGPNAGPQMARTQGHKWPYSGGIRPIKSTTSPPLNKDLNKDHNKSLSPSPPSPPVENQNPTIQQALPDPGPLPDAPSLPDQIRKIAGLKKMPRVAPKSDAEWQAEQQRQLKALRDRGLIK